MTQTAAEIWRDFETVNVPSSGANKPDKADIRAWGTLMEDLRAGVGIAYPTLALLNADLAHDQGTLAMVYADGSPANGGLYRKNGASGTGLWVRIGDSPNDVIRLTVTGGTGNDIQVTTPETPTTPGDKLFLMTPTAANTGAVTIATNGGTAASVKNALGATMAANALMPALPVLLAWQVDHYQTLVSLPVDASGVLTDTLAARDAAAASAAAAASSAAALGNQVHQYDTRAQAIAATIAVGIQAIKITRHAAGYPLSFATYIPGTSAGPMAFAEAGGHYWELDLSGKQLLVPWFGAKGDGVADDTAAVQTAVNNSVGRRLDGMGQSYKLMTTVVGVDRIELVNATIATGADAAHPLFNFAEKTGWKLRRIWFKSSYPTTLDYTLSKTGAVLFGYSGAGALTDMAIEDCSFSDFSDNYWVNATVSGSGTINNFRFCRNYIFSTGLGAGANYREQFHALLSLYGTSANVNGMFVGTTVEDNFGDFTDLIAGFMLWSRHSGFKVRGNNIRNVGANSTFSSHPTAQTDINCYGIAVYDAVAGSVGGASQNCGIHGEIAHNYILNPPSAGIYFANAEDIDVHDNIVIGQFRTDDATLPRGGISGNDLRRSRIHHNRLIGCWTGIAVASIYNADVTEVSDNDIYGSAAADSSGFRLGVTAGAATGSTIAIRRNTVRMFGASAPGLRCAASDASNKLGVLVVEGNDFICAYQGVGLGAVKAAGSITIKNNKYAGQMSGGALVVNAVDTVMLIQGETFYLNTSIGVGVNLDGSVAVAFVDSLFVNKLTGSPCVSAIGALGVIDGIRFKSCAGALRIAAGSLGYVIPASAGQAGDIVQNLSVNAYTAGQPQYWIYSGTAWLPHNL